MQAIKFQTKVTQRGTLRLPRLRLKRGASVEVIVLVHEPEDEFTELARAAEATLEFWDNAVDDEVWNDA